VRLYELFDLILYILCYGTDYFVVQAKDKELERLNVQCKELTENLKLAVTEKEELASLYRELVKNKETVESDLNGLLSAAQESGKNSELEGMGHFTKLSFVSRVGNLRFDPNNDSMHLSVQAKELELEALNGRCKELTENLEKAAREKEELAGLYSELVKNKESVETDLNCLLEAAQESSKELQLLGIRC
jgi:hypothetical protein